LAQEFKKTKRASRGSYENNKFCILNKAKQSDLQLTRNHQAMVIIEGSSTKQLELSKPVVPHLTAITSKEQNVPLITLYWTQ
jgi:hypothetical protein